MSSGPGFNDSIISGRLRAWGGVVCCFLGGGVVVFFGGGIFNWSSSCAAPL